MERKPRKKRPLTAEEAEICARFDMLWQERAGPLGLTQESAAASIGISQGAIGHFKAGRTAIGFETVFQLAFLLRVHPYIINPYLRDRLPADLQKAVDSMQVFDPLNGRTSWKIPQYEPAFVAEKKKT